MIINCADTPNIERVMSDWLKLKEDDTMVGKYRKQLDGIILNKENLPAIFKEFLKLNVTRVKYDLDNEELSVSLLGGKEKCYGFGALMKFSEDSVKVTYPKYSKYYIAYTLWESGMRGIKALYDARNVRNIHLNNTNAFDQGYIKIDLRNWESITEELMDTILVFDDEGEFVEIVHNPSLSPDTDMAKHGYVRVYDD